MALICRQWTLQLRVIECVVLSVLMLEVVSLFSSRYVWIDSSGRSSTSRNWNGT
jgi:hypothetical protein